MHKLIHEDWSTDETLTTDAEEERRDLPAHKGERKGTAK